MLALLIAAALGPAGGTGHQAMLTAHAGRPYFVGWRVQVDEPDLFEWHPREAAAPLPDPAGGRVYAATNDGLIVCVEDGRPLWRFHGEGGFEAQPRTGPGALYAASSGGKLYAVNAATGKQLWEYDTKEDLGTTPALGGGRVIVASLSDAIIAVEASSGAFAWQYRREATGQFTIRGAASPVVVGDVAYAAFSDGYVVALGVADGAVRWERRVSPEGEYLDVDGGPIVAGDRVYVAGFSAGVVALDARTGELVWQHLIPGALQLALDGPRLVVAGMGKTIAVRRADGATVWTFRFAGQPTRPVAHRGLVVFGTNDGPMFLLESTTGRPMGTFDPGSGFAAAPAARGGAIYALSNGGNLYALGIAP